MTSRRREKDRKKNPDTIKSKIRVSLKIKLMIQSKPYTVTGLAVALDTTRDTLIDYQKKDEFSDTIKRAKEMCHQYAEDSLFIGKNPIGAIFNLKNNYGWQDKQEVDHTSKEKRIVSFNYYVPIQTNGKITYKKVSELEAFKTKQP